MEKTEHESGFTGYLCGIKKLMDHKRKMAWAKYVFQSACKTIFGKNIGEKMYFYLS